MHARVCTCAHVSSPRPSPRRPTRGWGLLSAIRVRLCVPSGWPWPDRPGFLPAPCSQLARSPRPSPGPHADYSADFQGTKRRPALGLVTPNVASIPKAPPSMGLGLPTPTSLSRPSRAPGHLPRLASILSGRPGLGEQARGRGGRKGSPGIARHPAAPPPPALTLTLQRPPPKWC
jgi:hypothetical protein